MTAQSLWSLGGLSWKELAKRVYNEIFEDDVLGSAAQLAYYFLFALFPLLIFLTSIFGFIVGANDQLRKSLFSYLGSILPGTALDLVQGVISEVSQASSGSKISLGLFLALWAASSGLEAVTGGLNRAYGVKETRPWWKVRLIAIFLTIALAITINSALALILFGGHIVDYAQEALQLGTILSSLWVVGQYLIALAFVLLGFALIYYFSPDIRDQKWFFVTPGSVVALVLWLLVSFGFRLYLSYFNSYSATYGSLGALIILLLWLYFTGAAILIGGEINSEIENAAAKAGAPDAKENGEKAPGQKDEALAEKPEKKPEKKAVEGEIIEAPKKKPDAAKFETGIRAKNTERRSILAKAATIGSIIAGVFMSFGGRKNEKR